MTALVNLTDITAWVEVSKMGPGFTALDTNLEPQISGEVLASLSPTFDVSAWVDPTTTPLMVRRVIAMRYTAWKYYALVGDNDEGNAYADLLLSRSDTLLAAIITGTVAIPGLPDGTNLGTSQPGYYPTDESSAMCPTFDDTSLGGPKFSMGRIW